MHPAWSIFDYPCRCASFRVPSAIIIFFLNSIIFSQRIVGSKDTLCSFWKSCFIIRVYSLNQYQWIVSLFQRLFKELFSYIRELSVRMSLIFQFSFERLCNFGRTVWYEKLRIIISLKESWAHLSDFEINKVCLKLIHKFKKTRKWNFNNTMCLFENQFLGNDKLLLEQVFNFYENNI